MTTLRIRQGPLNKGKYPITLTLRRPGQPELEAEARIEFALTPQEQEELRWYVMRDPQSDSAIALRDYQRYQGRAAADEAECPATSPAIADILAELPD